MERYVIEGKLHKGNNRIFIETEADENDCPVGTWIDEIVENIPENAKVTIIIDFEKM